MSWRRLPKFEKSAWREVRNDSITVSAVVAKLTGESAPRVPGYVLGFPIGDELAREIDAMGPDLPRRAAQSNARCHVALAPDALAMCSSAQLPNLIGQAISRPINFMTNEARGMPLVPPEVLAFVQKVWSGV